MEKINYAFISKEIFARIIRCEAEGEGDTGMKAVATVVMNRVHIPWRVSKKPGFTPCHYVPDQFTLLKKS